MHQIQSGLGDCLPGIGLLVCYKIDLSGSAGIQVERPVGGAETEKPSDPAKPENEGILRIPPGARATGLASSFSWTEKWPRDSSTVQVRDQTSTAGPIS